MESNNFAGYRCVMIDTQSASPTRMTTGLAKTFIRTSWSGSHRFVSPPNQSRRPKTGHTRNVRSRKNGNVDAHGYPIIPTGRADHPETNQGAPHPTHQPLGRHHDRAS